MQLSGRGVRKAFGLWKRNGVPKGIRRRLRSRKGPETKVLEECEAYPPPSAGEAGREEELSMLRREADAIRNSLEYITGRIAELEKGE